MKNRKLWNTLLTIFDADLPEHGLMKGDIGEVVRVRGAREVKLANCE